MKLDAYTPEEIKSRLLATPSPVTLGDIVKAVVGESSTAFLPNALVRLADILAGRELR